MFNNPTMECTKGKQLAVCPHKYRCKWKYWRADTQSRTTAACQSSKRKRDKVTRVEPRMIGRFRDFQSERRRH